MDQVLSRVRSLHSPDRILYIWQKDVRDEARHYACLSHKGLLQCEKIGEEKVRKGLRGSEPAARKVNSWRKRRREDRAHVKRERERERESREEREREREREREGQRETEREEDRQEEDKEDKRAGDASVKKSLTPSRHNLISRCMMGCAVLCDCGVYCYVCVL